jgi:hypothetical protein
VTRRNLEPFRGPKFITIEVPIDHLVCSVPEMLTVEWPVHDEKTHAEYRLSLGEFDLALVGAFGARMLRRLATETIKGTAGL